MPPVLYTLTVSNCTPRPPKLNSVAAQTVHQIFYLIIRYLNNAFVCGEDKIALKSNLSDECRNIKAEIEAARVITLSAENHNALNLGFGQSPMSKRLLWSVHCYRTTSITALFNFAVQGVQPARSHCSVLRGIFK